MIDFKEIKIESLVPFIVLGLILLVIIGVLKIVFSLMLTVGLGNIFGAITTTDTILFLILLILVRFYLLATEKK